MGQHGGDGPVVGRGQVVTALVLLLQCGRADLHLVSSRG